MKADLHIHTKESDGCLTVEEVLQTASQEGLEFLAITDHETTSGVEKANTLAFQYGIRIIPGIEFSTIYRDEEIHLLGYYKDIHNEELQEKLLQIRRERTEISRRMVNKIETEGIDIHWDEVQKCASPEGIICKTHIMVAIWNKEQKFEKNYWNNITSWFKPGGIAFIPYEGNPYQKAVDFIYRTGGLPVLAHPGLIKNRSIIKDLLSYRRIGIEVYYGYWEEQVKNIAYFKELSTQAAVLATGGSDYHGFFSPVKIGKVDLPDQCVKDLTSYLQIE